MTDRWTITVPEEVAEQVMVELDWGDSRSAWIVDAIERKLASEGGAPDIDPAALVDNVDGLSAGDREGAVAIVAYLAANNVAAKQQLIDEVFPEAPGNRSSAANWYKQIVGALESAGVVERDGQGKIWLAED